jgi:hypothetical protein
MREFSKIKTTVWKSKRLRALADKVLTPRILFLYLLANEHGNSCGCFDLDPLYVCADLQCSNEDFERCMKALCEVSLVSFDSATTTVLIHKWEDENAPTNPKHAMGLFAHMENASSETLRKRCFDVYVPIIKVLKMDQTASVRLAMDRVKASLSKVSESPLRDPLHPDPDQRPRPETETQTRPRPDLDAQKDLRTALPAAPLTGSGQAPLRAEDFGAVADDDETERLYSKLDKLGKAVKAKAQAPPHTPSRLLETSLMKRGVA